MNNKGVCYINTRFSFVTFKSGVTVINSTPHDITFMDIDGTIINVPSSMLNIYVQENSTTMNTCLISNIYSLTGSAIEWTNDSANNRYYNTQANIYIYPVANVYQAKVDNGD